MKALIAILLLSIMLTGCGGEDITEEIPEVVEISLSERFDESVCIDKYFVDALGDYSGFIEVSDREMEIHPYYDGAEKVTVTVMLLSDNDWWDGIISDFGDTVVYEEYDSYSMFTTSDGRTYGYMQCSDNEAIIAYTDDLPSGYIKLVMDKIWM